MDNTFLKDDLIERYVLNQLNDEELANFRGELMFDENLRQQVVETKMLIRGLATIAGEGSIASPPSTSKVIPAPTPNYTLLRAAMVIGAIFLAGLTYYFYFSYDATDTTSSAKEEKQETNDTAIPKTDESSSLENETIKESSKDQTAPIKEEKEKPRIFASNTPNKKASTKPEKEIVVNGDEEIVFGLGNPAKAPVNFFEEEEGNLGYAQTDEVVNKFIEDAITNSTTKSKIGTVKIKNFENSKTIARNKNKAISLNIEGSIDTKASNNKKYVFKLFDNNTEAFIDNTPLTQEYLKPLLLGVEKYDFKIDMLIQLEPGLYYFTIEEQVNDDQDMIYAGRFYVSAGKFFVE
jgi:hypothetical protein